MLKNKKEREEYLSNRNNWSIVFQDDEHGIRLLKLNVGDIYRLETYTTDRYLGDHWVQSGYCKYTIIKNGFHKEINNTDVLNLMMKL